MKLFIAMIIVEVCPKKLLSKRLIYILNLMPFGSLLHVACLSDALSYDSFQLILNGSPKAAFAKYELGIISPLDMFINLWERFSF